MTVLPGLILIAPLLAAGIGFWLLARELAARDAVPRDPRLSFIIATVGWAVLLTALTEFAGWLHSFNRPALAALWWSATALLLSVAIRLRIRRLGNAGSALASLRPQPGVIRGALGILGAEWLLMLIVAAFVVFLGLVALLTPTTNWDSLTYHLPRVFHWVQQQSLAHYPTSIERQIEMGPWAAMLQLQLLLLSGADQFANMIQWFAMAGSALVGSLIARQLLPEPVVSRARLEFFAAVLIVTLPIGIVESINPQTDYVTAFWLLCVISLTLEIHRSPHLGWLWVFAALAGALGLLTKVTTVLYAAPFAAALVVIAFRNFPPLRAAGRLLALGGLVFLVNLPHAARNQQLYGSPTGSPALKRATTNARFSIAITLSNVIRNVALHTGTGIRPLTHGLNLTVGWLHALTGRELNDPESTFGKAGFSFSDELTVSDSYAGCPYHVALVAAALVVGAARYRHCRRLLWYAAMILGSALLICVLLRWQRWNTRIHLPCLAALMPFVAAVLAPRLGRAGVWSICAAVGVFGCVVVAKNDSRPIFNATFRAMPRVQQMLVLHSGDLHSQIRNISEQVVAARSSAVGLRFSVDEPELPFWLLLLGQGFNGRIDHVLVPNPSGRIPIPRAPDVIINALENPLPPQVARRYPTTTTVGPYTLHWAAAPASAGTPAPAP